MNSGFKRRFSKSLAVFMACAMAFTAAPVASSKNVVNVKADEATSPLTTIWKTSEVGSHEGTGSYVYDATTKTVKLTGAGTKFDKSAGSDDLFLAYFTGKGKLTVTAKMQVSGSAGFAGLIIRNTADEAGSASAGLYADMVNGSKNQIRYGYHKENAGGGASQVNSNVTTASDSIYVRLTAEGTKATYEVSSDASFSEETTKVKTQTIDGLDAKVVGFFATAGMEATFSDVLVTSENTEDGVTTKKVIFSSELGELIPEYSSSKDYSGDYKDDITFTSTVNENELALKAVRVSNKGNMREDQSVDYLLFPETDKNWTVSADITINKYDSGTDKHGVGIGQFVVADGTKAKLDVLHAQKNKVAQHTFTTTEGGGACGDPKTASNVPDNATYYFEYSKQAADETHASGTALLTVKTAGGEMLLDGGVYDLASSNAALAAGQKVRYGIAVCVGDVVVTNLKLTDENGYVIYDQNDYYVAAGVAPVVDKITKTEIASDRSTIDLEWDFTEGKGNQLFTVLVSKDGSEYTLAGTSKVNSFSYVPSGDGKYTFKVFGKAGDNTSADSAKISEAVDYVTPLSTPTLTAVGSDSKVELTFADVEGATKYELYKTNAVTGEFEKIKEFTTERSYTDTDVVNEIPYKYYMVAANDTNTSEPSVATQALPTAGHVGEYEYGADAAKLTVTDKSNDTVFDSKATVSIKSDKAGTFKLYVNDDKTAVKEVAAAADEAVTFTCDLQDGRNDVNVIFEDEAGKLTRKTFNFVSNPVIDVVVDAAFTGNDGDEVDGYKTYKTVGAAVAAVPSDNAEAVVIFIKNGEYNERVIVTAPNISLLGEDAVKTHIFDDHCVGNKKATGMWDRNTVYVDSSADGFTAENLTIENSFEYTNGSDQQADALCIVADSTICINVRVIGYQDSLLTSTRVKDESGNYEVTKQLFNKCYITGNVDFIYGAGSSVFTDCDIVARYTEYKKDGCFMAPNTYATTPYGYIFVGCRFLAEEGIADGAYRLARPWGADASATFLECYMGPVLLDTAYGDMSGNSYKDARFAEFYTYGEAFKVNDDRPQMNPAEVLALISTVENDFAYIKKAPEMYLGEKAAEDVTTPEETTPEVTEPEATKPESTPATGDTAPVMPLAALMSLAGAALVFVKKRK